jgi:hypothetical protein
METKTSKAVELFKSGNITGALKIFKGFKIGFTKDEQRKLQIAYESMTGNDSFYRSLQLDTATISTEAIQIIKQKYNV